MEYNDILILDAFRDEENLDKWNEMGFKKIMEALKFKLDYYESYVSIYGENICDCNTVLENLKKSTYQIVGSYIFSAYRDYTYNDGMGSPFAGRHGHAFFEKCLDILQDKYFELTNAHEFCSYNRDLLENDSACGCFYCLELYNPAEITEWCCEPEAGRVTVLCPRCGIDSVIPESAGYPLTEEFLKSMNDFWFYGCCGDAAEAEDTVDISPCKQNYTYKVSLDRLPIGEKQINSFLRLLGMVKERKDTCVIIEINDKEQTENVPQKILFAGSENGIYMELEYQMDDFGWKHPLHLANDRLTENEAASLLKSILADITDENPVINNSFREIDSILYPGESEEET